MEKDHLGLEIFKAYTKDLSSIGLKDSNELSFRNAFERLLKAISAENKNIHILHEPKRDKEFGSPDFRVTDIEAILGYVETKKIGEDLEALIESPQIKKYRQLSPNLVLTNYIDFIWINGKYISPKISLGSIDMFFVNMPPYSSKNKNNILEVYELLNNFFSVAPKGIKTNKELAKQLAPRSTHLRDFFKNKLENSKEQNNLLDLYEAFKKRVFKKFTTDEFANVFAQMGVSGRKIPKTPLAYCTNNYLHHYVSLIRSKW